jgi:hypothetical protein
MLHCTAKMLMGKRRTPVKVVQKVQDSKLLDLPTDLEREIYSNMDVHTLKNVFECHKEPPSVVKEVLHKKMGELVEILETIRTFNSLKMKLVFQKKNYKVQLDIKVMYASFTMTFTETLLDENKQLTLDWISSQDKIPVKEWRFHDKMRDERYSFLVIFMELLRLGSTNLKCNIDFEDIMLELKYPFRSPKTEEEKVMRESAPERAALLQDRLLAWIETNVAPLKKPVKDNKFHVMRYLRDFELFQIYVNKTKSLTHYLR